MSARPLHVLPVGAALILSTIAPVPTFAEVETTGWNVQELYKQCKARRGSLDEMFCLEFVSAVARQVFRNGLALKDIKKTNPPRHATRHQSGSRHSDSIRSASRNRICR